ncbi:MAG: hypothetical protein WCN95_02820, partial [bacterium]
VYWSYLPTDRPAGHGLQIHGDFYLTSSRADVRFGTPGRITTAQDYNASLLDKAADCVVDDLWTRPAVVSRNDFWRLVSPLSCNCIDLRRMVAGRLIKKDRFIKLVKEGFSADPAQAGWTRRRYTEFFKALEAWAQLAHDDKLVPGSRAKIAAMFRQWVQESGARVLLIIESADENSDPSVTEALPLVKREGRRPYMDTVFLRKSEGVVLPKVIREQHTWTTTFHPSGMENNPGTFGLIDFNRVEILANIRPADPQETRSCDELIVTALDLAAEKNEAGGLPPVLQRIESTGAGPAWGWMISEPEMRNAAAALRKLHVPTCGGIYLPAKDVSDPPDDVRSNKDLSLAWPWPIVDCCAIDAILANRGQPIAVSSRQACTLLGITCAPLSVSESARTLSISDWEHSVSIPEKRAAIATGIIRGWERGIGPLVRYPEGLTVMSTRQLAGALQRSTWIPLLGPEVMGCNLHLPDDARTAFAPDDVWLKEVGAGYQHIDMLPHLQQIHRGQTPQWVSDLGITKVDDKASRNSRLEGALHRLRQNVDIITEKEAELLELYSILIRTYAEAGHKPSDDRLPVLARHHGLNGRRGSLRWIASGESVWFDNGEHSYALRAFSDFNLWVVRHTSAELGKLLDIETFIPNAKPERLNSLDSPMAAQLRAKVLDALPDVLAAIEASGLVTVSAGEITARWNSLSFTHWQHVQRSFTFVDKTGAIGHDQQNNVVLVDAPEGGEIAFDGTDLHALMVEAAEPLAYALVRDKRCVHVFEAILGAFSSEAGRVDSGVSVHVNKHRKKWSITDTEVSRWRMLFAAGMLSAAEQDEWLSVVGLTLSAFGTPDQGMQKVRPVIRPDYWLKTTSAPTDTVVKDRLIQALAACTPKVKALVPLVDFAGYHLAVLGRQVDMEWQNLLADVLAGLSEAEWLEPTLDGLEKKIRAEPSADESAHLCHLRCDVMQVLRKRLDLNAPVTRDTDKWKRALLFVKRELQVPRLPPLVPSETGQVAFVEIEPWKDGILPPSLRDAMTEQQYIDDQRRKAKRGEAAETAVLQKAVANAIAWLAADAASFWHSVAGCLGGYLEGKEAEARKKVETARREYESGGKETPIRTLLHLSATWGDVGFDVIVPDRPNVVLVEVKRIPTDEHVVVYLSENERAQALRAGPAGPWRLWLVDNDGKCRDATRSVLVRLQASQSQIDELKQSGIRPGDYALRIRLPRDGCASSDQ